MPSEYRYENKYLASEETLLMLGHKLRYCMKNDSHTGIDGTYCIRSLYYDDDRNSGYYENLNGVDPRAKYRLRFYVGDNRLFKLERKEKNHSMTKKTSCVLSYEQVERLVNTNDIKYKEDLPPLLKKFYFDIRTKGFKPKVIVEYDRMPFVYEVGNVRITFDRNIRSSDNTSDFLKEDIPFRLIMPRGIHVLEVKYDHFLPDYIRQLVYTPNVIFTDYSKYCMCRKFGLNANFL